MIKDLLLSLAIAAFSGVSSFVGSPKRSLPATTYNVDIGGTFDYSTSLASQSFNNLSYVAIFNDGESERTITSGDPNYVRFNPTNYQIYFNAGGEPFTLSVSNGAIRASMEDPDNPFNTLYATSLSITFSSAFDFGDYEDWFMAYMEPLTQYTITKTLINCSINSTPEELPTTYIQTGQTYTIYGQANEDLGGSYGFNSSSLTLTGVSTSNFELTNEIGSSGLYRGCSFSITLPANDITIRLEAFMPGYTITATLNNCTASPSVPSSYSGLYAEDFTFTAESGYAFNSLVTSWEFGENITAQEPTFSGKLYGSLYENVTFRLVFENGNCNFRITAAAFNLDSYSEGYDSGYSIGYDKGHADGEIAGNSYGVWNWLKQAALTTGEFLSINLLPGFSIGGLLTALAGLMIIWLFIKGFLFKS